MAEIKYFTVKKTINGVEYTAQFNGVSAALRAIDDNYIPGSKVTSSEGLSKYVLENVIVEPKGLKIDDFETVEELNDVVNWGVDVMNGKFRPRKDIEPATRADSE
ncbi:MAG: hypothetical protein NC177_18025 [Ruminococcus flavefaciens]|nr:hypothetical protein [Ruminococcus flavefaciens]